MNEEGHVTAVHEAAHAVVAARLGRSPTKLQLWVHDEGEFWNVGGCVSLPDWPDPDASGRWDHRACADAIAIMAGRAAERLLGIPSRADGHVQRWHSR